MRLTLPLLLLFILQPCLAEDIEGTVSCKVKSVSVTTMEEGMPKVYSGVKDGLSKNDQVLFRYFYDPLFPRVTLRWKKAASDFGLFSSGKVRRQTGLVREWLPNVSLKFLFPLLGTNT